MKELIQVLPKELERVPINSLIHYIDYDVFLKLAMEMVKGYDPSPATLEAWIHSTAKDKWENPDPNRPSAMYGVHNRRTLIMVRMDLDVSLTTMVTIIKECLEEHNLMSYLELPTSLRIVKSYKGKRRILAFRIEDGK